MIDTNGRFLTETIESLGLSGDDRTQAITNAQNILTKVISTYERHVGRGHVGAGGRGISRRITRTQPGPGGLIYGRIQSGKTRGMIVTTAMAFDNGFKVSVVMTSNINDLVNQTHLDFTRDLNGVTVFTKDDELDMQIDDAKLEMESEDGRILVIASKGGGSLRNITRFLTDIDARSYPMIIFDDEGDQASLDTNTYRRSASGNLTLEKSTINRLIDRVRRDFPASIYVSVTGTPQAILLQSASSDNRPSFVEMLPPGASYIGGDYFFDTEEPEDNRHHLISIVPSEDKTRLLNPNQPIPEGLKSSILFFLLSASAAIRKLGFPDRPRERDKGYQFLCHPSLKNNEQAQAEIRISDFLTEVKAVLMGRADNSGIGEGLRLQYESLQQQLGINEVPLLDDLRQTMLDQLRRKKILVINAQNNRRRGIEYGPGFNFLIGGNTLGRGIAIPNLLVTYYVRSAGMTQIDTMHQHARMFGYRERTLGYTRLFTTRQLYYRFRDIHYSDRGLRSFIQAHQNTYPNSFPVEISAGLRATRPGVLDINNTEAIWPGMQIFPNFIQIPQSTRAYNSVMRIISEELDVPIGDIDGLSAAGRAGVMIGKARAIEIVSKIKTQSKNSWNDKTIDAVVNKLCQRLGNRIRLKFRTAERTIGQDGLLASGTLSGAEQDEARGENCPTLWIMSVTGSQNSEVGAGETFMYPTVVVPNGLPKVFIFSKK